jgi:hypothetical protein
MTYFEPSLTCLCLQNYTSNNDTELYNCGTLNVMYLHVTHTATFQLHQVTINNLYVGMYIIGFEITEGEYIKTMS